MCLVVNLCNMDWNSLKICCYCTKLVIFTQWKHFSGMVYTCKLCEGNYESFKGLRIHQWSCKKRFIRNNNVIATPLADDYENVSDAQIETDILPADEFVIDRIPEVVPNLSNYPESTKSRFSYHDIPGETFANLINDLYNEIAAWKKNLFKLPTGNAAKAFTKELSLWLERFNRKTEIIALR